MLERSEYPPGVPCWVDTSQPDPEAAARFYGGLLGWEFEDRMPADAPGSYLVATLHGRDVAAVGSQMEGSPPTPVWSTYIAVDSADDTATRITKAGGSTLADDVPPHWSVTFAVDDADATAARAEELGGALVAPPMDAGPTRIAVVRDPQGAVFTASRFYPERL